jgi:hypothetical protein
MSAVDCRTRRCAKCTGCGDTPRHQHNTKDLRHYTATELISGGVDVRTVAGRLGHGGGGATTLRVYAAWTSEADERAARTVSGRMPARPQGVAEKPSGTGLAAPHVESAVDSPYLKIANDPRGAIESGVDAERGGLPMACGEPGSAAQPAYPAYFPTLVGSMVASSARWAVVRSARSAAQCDPGMHIAQRGEAHSSSARVPMTANAWEGRGT